MVYQQKFCVLLGDETECFVVIAFVYRRRVAISLAGRPLQEWIPCAVTCLTCNQALDGFIGYDSPFYGHVHGKVLDG